MRTIALWGFLFLCLFFFASGVSGQQETFVDGTSLANDPSQIVFNVHYQLNKADPSRIDSLSLTLHPTTPAAIPTIVQVQLVSDSDSWYSCKSHGSTWSCQTGDHPLLTIIDQVQVKTWP